MVRGRMGSAPSVARTTGSLRNDLPVVRDHGFLPALVQVPGFGCPVWARTAIPPR
jgi:hypothetical protein